MHCPSPAPGPSSAAENGLMEFDKLITVQGPLTGVSPGADTQQRLSPTEEFGLQQQATQPGHGHVLWTSKLKSGT